MRVKTVAEVLVCLTSVAFGQGSLTPSGAPAPTMKTLDQVEPRIPISGAYTINQPGSYYLTGNSTGKISISASDVTLDLMGFRIENTGNQAISISSGENILIHNGILRSGVGYTALYAPNVNNCRIENLRIDGHNASVGGIRMKDNNVIRNCDIRNCTAYGIIVGEKAEITDCRITHITAEKALLAKSGSRILNNVIEDNGGKGLHITGSGSYIANNIVKGNGDNYNITAGNQLNILLCEVPETLDWPCSVKFAGTLICTSNNVDGITVNSDGVTIDLDGHSLVGPGSSSGHGIYQSNTRRNLTVKNGKVIEWQGSGKCGISTLGKSSIISSLQASTNYYGIKTGSESTISDCIASKNTVGIHTGNGSTVSDCAVNKNDSTGISVDDESTVSDCAAYQNVGYGIFSDGSSMIHDCIVTRNGSTGIHLSGNDTVQDCVISSNEGSGIYTYYGSTIRDCTVNFNRGDGINVRENCRIVGNICRGNGDSGDGAGIHANTHDTLIDSNTVMDNDRGIDVDSYGNFITRNTASENTTNYDIASGNDTGSIKTTPVNAGAWDNFNF